MSGGKATKRSPDEKGLQEVKSKKINLKRCVFERAPLGVRLA